MKGGPGCGAGSDALPPAVALGVLLAYAVWRRRARAADAAAMVALGLVGAAVVAPESRAQVPTDFVVEQFEPLPNQGSDKYNLDLSNRRAASVMRYLINKGIDPARLSSQGFGESTPLDTNATEKGRATNRRVEFTILSARGKSIEVQVEDNRAITTDI